MSEKHSERAVETSVNYKKVILFICMAVMLGLLLCLFVFPPPKAAEPVTLNVALYGYIPDYGSFEDTVRESWEEAHPEVKLHFVQWDCYESVVPDDLDVFVFDAINLDVFADAGSLLPLSEEDIEDYDDLIPSFMNGCRIDGTIYAVPQLLCTDFLFTRKSGQKSSCIFRRSSTKRKSIWILIQRSRRERCPREQSCRWRRSGICGIQTPKAWSTKTTDITTREGSRRDSSGGLRFPHQAGRRRVSAGSKEKCRPAAGLPIRANSGRSLMQCAAMRCGTDQTRPPRRYADEDYSGKVLYRNELDSNQHFQVLRKPLDKTIAAKIPNRIPFFPAGVLAT